MVEKRPMKATEEWYNFLLKFGANRVKSGVDIRTGNFCDLPDIIVKYFKLNNDRYLELVNLEAKNGVK